MADKPRTFLFTPKTAFLVRSYEGSTETRTAHPSFNGFTPNGADELSGVSGATRPSASGAIGARCCRFGRRGRASCLLSQVGFRPEHPGQQGWDGEICIEHFPMRIHPVRAAAEVDWPESRAWSRRQESPHLDSDSRRMSRSTTNSDFGSLTVASWTAKSCGPSGRGAQREHIVVDLGGDQAIDFTRYKTRG